VYELVVKGGFSAAHNLRDYQGRCESLHGHNWKVEIYVRSSTLKGGMAIDFQVLKGELRAVLEELDHKYLNELPYFKEREPSSENIARYIYEGLRGRLEGQGVNLWKVTVWESEGAGASWVEEGDGGRSEPEG